MQNALLTFDSAQEKDRIVTFLRKTFLSQNIEKAVIGLSGGLDSTVSFFLLKEVLPPEKIIVAHLFYDTPLFTKISPVLNQAKIPPENIHLLSIKESVDATAKLLQLDEKNKVRKGNIAARTRMIFLFDLAKKYNALVCGTENRSEYLLGYFTRFGDQASDIEPIEHLYKAQVIALAKYLDVPQEIIDQKPSANLWEGQTDEGEFGFGYEEADQVLALAVDQQLSVEEIQARGYPNAEKIFAWKEKNSFKHTTPYKLEL